MNENLRSTTITPSPPRALHADDAGLCFCQRVVEGVQGTIRSKSAPLSTIELPLA